MIAKLNLYFSRILNIVNSPITKVIRTTKPTLEKDGIKNFSQVANTFQYVIQKVIAPILMIIGALGVVYCVYLGVLYAKAESAEKRKEIQGRLIGACIGAVIIIAGATLCFALNWAEIYHNFSKSHSYIDTNDDGQCDTCAAAQKTS